VSEILNSLGFEDISITNKENSADIIQSWGTDKEAQNLVFSAYIRFRKPLTNLEDTD